MSCVPDVHVQVPVDGYPIVGPRGELALGAPQMALPYAVKQCTQLILYKEEIRLNLCSY